MNKLFYQDTIAEIEISYGQLLSDLACQTTYQLYCKSDSYYTVFKQIIFSLLIGKEIILLDYDFSIDEIKNLIGGDFQKKEVNREIEPIGKIKFCELYERIEANRDSWRITLFSSGTTGRPKKISHTIDSISRHVKKDEKREDNIWGFAYNPTHMSGLQVFFQAFLNHNTIIRLFGVERTKIFDLINKFRITNISATPTFYRFLLPVDQVCDSVQNLTFGGEKFDENTFQLMHQIFVNRKIRNVYASTEAGTLFSSQGDVFTLKPEMLHVVKIIDNELYLHNSLLSKAESPKLINEWHATGDLVTVLSDIPFSFKFTGRKTGMINTGGYKVNPTEVEEVIRQCNGVKDAYVFGKKNSLLGNIVCCELVRTGGSLTEKNIREFLQSKLQEYKIPRVDNFVDCIATTKTGKISRNK